MDDPKLSQNPGLTRLSTPESKLGRNSSWQRLAQQQEVDRVF